MNIQSQSTHLAIHKDVADKANHRTCPFGNIDQWISHDPCPINVI